MINNNYCVIMAGGSGSRFWPLSTTDCPKQFLDPMGLGKSFIRMTFERFLPIIPIENFFVVTSVAHRDKVMEHLPELSCDQILLEPIRRNTAPCIEYAMCRIEKINPNACVVVAPSDHLITNESEFLHIVKDGLEFVDGSDNLMTIGIRPNRPETLYGYIQFDQNVKIGNIDKVKTFTEKPNLELATVFYESGEFLWNSGIFIWSIGGIQEAFKQFLPEIYCNFAAGKEFYGTPRENEFIDGLYPNCANISIDYGVMEKSQCVYVRGGEFGWSDIGTWGSLYGHMNKDENGNATVGRVLTYNTKNCVVNMPQGKIAILDGLDGYMVVEKGGSLLVCRVENEQAIRNWVDDVKYKFGEDYI